MSIQAKSLTKIYGEQKAIDQVSFNLEKGEITGFLGPNGAGKTTTMKILTCFMPPDEGEAWVSGFNVEKDPLEVKKLIGYLPESNPLYFEMYVREYLEFIAKIHSLGKSADKKIDEMIDLTGLEPEIHKKLGELSKGFKQRAGLAQAMIHDPEVLILDEPTSGLDPNQLSEIRDLILRVGKEKTLLLSTHIMQEVQALCDRVIIINKGKIVADDKTENLKGKISSGQVLHVEFSKDPDPEKIKEIEGIEKVERKSNNSWEITVKGTREVRPELNEYAIKNDLDILSLSKEEQSIEQVFQKLTK